MGELVKSWRICVCVSVCIDRGEVESEGGQSNKWCFQLTECKYFDLICGQWARLHEHLLHSPPRLMCMAWIQLPWKMWIPMFWHKFLSRVRNRKEAYPISIYTHVLHNSTFYTAPIILTFRAETRKIASHLAAFKRYISNGSVISNMASVCMWARNTWTVSVWFQ